MESDAHLYLEQLRGLPFVRAAKPLAKKAMADLLVEISTPSGPVRFEVELKKTFLTTEAIDGFIARQRFAHPGSRWMLMAPAIGAAAAEKLVTAGINFVDRDGNCFVRIDDRYVARVQMRERKPRRTPAAKGLRAPGYQALFALLVHPVLMKATVRELADFAGVSRETAHVVRPRLVEHGLAVETRGHFDWVTARLRDALDLWLSGYGTVLRPALLLGTYRTADKTPAELEKRLESVAAEHHQPFLWGGAAAAFRIDKYYRGPLTTIHFEHPSPAFPKWLHAVPDGRGPLTILRSFGSVASLGAAPGMVHPLLAYAELLHEGDPRARDAAGELLANHLPHLAALRTPK